MAEEKESEENISALHKKITDAFQLFDYDSNNTVNVREIGTIMYSLGCFPSQADIREFTAKVGEDFSGVVHLDKFLPAMTKVLLENRFPPIPRSKLLQAFKVLDKDQKGYLKPEELTKYMMEKAEPFTQEEMDEMLTAHTHQKDNVIHYEKLIDKLTADQNM
ncbi:dynein regulatory complex protein 8-like [Fundulus heteroclitus]|uniref:EF-hand calcium-binding domain-containing protein 2 n=1 Tax=Fundulus heteroclitus TaxID=8078 RepID=A0A3Q2TS60_FUNHE|nr:dynein regulatory complex protein 8 [Fundulus heteroclitus]XP_035992352.1 dynein regulatory complex protein 8-like [Fundulus heteroclitus]